MGNSKVIGRVVAAAAVIVVLVVLVVVLFGGPPPYTVKADFQDASQLVKGNLVEVGGNSVGHVTDLELTPNGQAEVTMQISSSDLTPLHQGTIATVREASLSGVANRYVDLQMPGGNPPKIPSGGVIPPATRTTPSTWTRSSTPSMCRHART